MFWHHWRKRFQELMAQRAQRGRRQRHRQPTFRPLLESLEKRQMLAADIQGFNLTMIEGIEILPPTIVASIDAPSSTPVIFTLQNTGHASYGVASSSDYTFAGSATGPLTITIPVGSLSASASIHAIDDSIWEGQGSEDVELSVISITGFTGATGSTVAAGSIIENDDAPEVSLTFGSLTVSESVGSVPLIATLSAPTDQDSTIKFDSPGSSATEIDDYTLPAQLQITIPAGQTSGSVSIGIVNDSTSEPTETVVLELNVITSSPLGFAANSAASVSTLTITDDDVAPSLNINLPTASFNEEAGTASIVVTLSASLSTPLIVPLSFSGTGTFGVDYSASTTSVVFNVGETSATLVLTGLTDTRYEPGETVVVGIDSAPSGSQLGATTSGSLTITDNDSQPTVTLLAPVPNAVHESGSSTTLVFQLSNLSNDPVTIDLGTAGSATAGLDYSLSSTSLIIAAGQSTGSVTLTGLADAAPSFEGSETAIITIDAVNNGTENGTQAQSVTVVDQETPPALSIALSATSMSEVSGTVTMSATITGSTATQDIVVPFTLGGTATSGSDYTTTPGFGSTASGTITIPAGQTIGTVVLTSVDDLIDEGISESIAINIGTLPSSVTYTGSQTFAVSQVDNEATPSVELSFHTSSTTEGGVIRLLAELSGSSSQDVVINLSLAGTATSSDYTLPSSITIPANSLSASIALTTLFDFVVEGNETVVVTIASINSGAATEAIPQQVSASIVDLPVTLSRLGTGSLAESGTETIIASLGQTRAVDTTVSLTLTGTATSGSDYAITPAVIVIPANSLSASTAFTGVNDTADEADETAVITINVGSGATSSSQQVSLTLLDDDAAPTINLAINNATINENGGVATVTATLSAPSSQTITASITLGGSAASGSDYTPSGTLFTFAPGATVATLSFTALSDSIPESNESIVVSLGSLSSGVSAGATTTVSSSIVDTVVPTVTLSRGSATVPEGASTSIVATLSQTASQDITVTLGVSGTATSGSDYTLSSTTITILAGSLTGAVNLNSIDDTRDEADLESVIIDITGVAPGSAATENGTQSVTVSISDNDAAPSVTGFSISSTSLTESAQAASIVATIGAVSDQPVTINLAATGTATSGSDYVLSANTIVIPAGQTSASITLTTVLDATAEGNETVTIDIASVTNGLENGTRSVQATISNVATPGVSLTRVGTGDLAENGTTTIVATLSQTSSQAITINLGATGTATSASDYNLSANSIVIPSGSLSGSVSFTGVADNLDEPNESVTISIASIVPVDGAATSGSGTVSFILADNDAPPNISFSASAGSIAENGGTAIITATLAQVSGKDVTVNVSLGGTASSTSDYSLSTTSFVIPRGQTVGTFSVQSLNDSLNEVNETIVFTFSHAEAVNTNSANLQVAITDDDPAPSVSLSASTTSISELGSGQVQFVATLSAPAGRTITVPLNLTGTATASGDYTPGSASITIPAGATSGTVTLTAVNDNSTEGTETIIAALTASTDSSYQLSANSSSTVNILDNGNGINVTVQFSTASQTVTESGGTRSIVVTLSAARGTSTDVVLTQTGSATNLTDYSLSSTTISIPAGQTSASIAMTILTDNIVEDDETAILTLTAPSGTLAGANTTQTVTVLGNIQRSGSVVTVVGTEGDDTFTTNFTSPDVFTVTLRGPGATGGSVSRTFTVGDVTLVNFDGLGGSSDSSTISGSSASESVVMTSSSMFFARTVTSATASSAITVNVTNSERNNYNGDSADVVQLNGTANDETFIGTPTSSEMTFANSSNVNRVTNVKTVTADGLGGTDTVTFDDLGATTNESLVAGATSSQYFRSNIFAVLANNFEKVVGRSTGGTDDVQLTGSTGSETFYGLSTHSVMVRPNGGLATMIGFAETTVLPGSGGEDLVVFVGSTGADRFTGDFTAVIFSGSGFEYNVSGFDRYYAFGNGGNDTADLDDSSGNDTFYAISTGIYVVGPTRATQTLFAGSFNNVKVTSSGGTDKAVFYDTAGDETFTGDSDSALQVGAGFSFQALGFATVIVFAGSGNDQATLSDSSGNDVLTGSPENVVLSGAGYSLQVLGADGVAVNASAGGNDTAALSDTISNDAVFALGSRFQLRSARSLLRLAGFDSISANASLGGFDTRTVGGTDYALALTGNWLPF